MKHRSPKVLYFSLIQSRIKSFWEWVNEEGFKYCKNSFFSRAEAPQKFIHIADLPLFLNQYDDNLQSLHIIIDFGSMKEIDINIIRDTIVEFPEVQFLFDKHYSKESLSSFLFPEDELKSYTESYPEQEKKDIIHSWGTIANSINYSLVELNLKDPDDDFDSTLLFSRIINGLDNTFDASNLRYAIKYRKGLHLKVHSNFEKVQKSRFQYIAISIEEESRQNIFNSYSLYSNGYRVLPITTRQELKLVNDPERFKLPSNGIIIRDYDLQFEDENNNSVDEIRGFRYCEEDDFKQGSAFLTLVGKYIKYYNKGEGWNILFQKCNEKYKVANNYWDGLINSGFPLYFITKGPKHSIIDHPERNQKVFINKKNGKLHLPGLAKPVCGIYSSFLGLPEVKATYNKTRYSVDDPDYEISISRKEHDHSTPLDIYDMANNMIRRAESYYNENRYLLAALVSGEALEFLNGFHHRLTVKAYFIQAIAENAIAMDVVGSNELYLAKDALFRVNKIKEDVDRFYYGYEEKSKWNILNHIFSTCRQFCKDHEHFESEAVFISAIGHLNEGYEIPDIINEIKTIMRKFLNELISFGRLIMNWKEEKKHKIDGE